MQYFIGVALATIIIILAPEAHAEDSPFIAAYGKAHREYAKRLEAAQVQKKSLSPTDQKRIYDEVFAESNRLFLKESLEMNKRKFAIIQEMFRAPGKSREKSEKTRKLAQSQSIEGDEDNSEKAEKPIAASASSLPQASAKSAIETATTGNKIEPGAAEDVEYSKREFKDEELFFERSSNKRNPSD